MNKRVLIFLTALTMIAMSCKEQKKGQGLDITNLDIQSNANTDFYQYACGGWMKKFPLPAEYARYGSFDKLQEDNQKQVKELVEGLAKQPQKEGSVAAKIGDLFNIGMDSVSLDKNGIAPIKPMLDAIAGIKDAKGLQQQLAMLHKQYISPFFYLNVSADQKDSKMNILNIYQGGLGLPDRDYYIADDANSKEIRAKYQEHIARMFELAGFTKDIATKNAATILNLETVLAKASLSREELRDPAKNYNKMALADLQKTAPNLDWKAFFGSIGAGEVTAVNVGQPSFIKVADEQLKKTSLEDLKTYLTWNVINESAAFLTSAMEKQNFEFYGKTLSGKEVMKARWKRVVETLNSSLGEAVGQLYVEKYFPPAAKEKMLNLVTNLRSSLGERIAASPWMSDATKAKAKEKLAAIKVKIGYPDKWRDYSSLEIKKDSYWDNMLRSRAFEFSYNINKISKPVDPTEWQMTPQTVNAYYEPTANEICFPAAILQPPFFDFNADDAVNYGAIGVVIGHEMTHGFDDQGRQYDKEGNLNDWWSKEDSDKFNARTKVLVDHFNQIKVLDTLHANGVFTLGENIADQGGLQVSYYALGKALEKNPAPEKIDGFTPQQRFFLAYANVWAQNIRDKEIQRRTKVDPHSLGKWRVNGALPHVEAFLKAFDIKEGDAMYLPEEKRASIW